MTQVGQIYKCIICSNTVEVKAAGVGELVCCGQPMGLIPEKQEMAAAEPTPTITEENQVTEVKEEVSEPKATTTEEPTETNIE